MSQITIRDLPPALEREIRRLAAEADVSLSRASVTLLLKALGMDSEPQKRRELAEVASQWTDREFEEFTASTTGFGEIDTEVWS